MCLAKPDLVWQVCPHRSQHGGAEVVGAERVPVFALGLKEFLVLPLPDKSTVLDWVVLAVLLAIVFFTAESQDIDYPGLA